MNDEITRLLPLADSSKVTPFTKKGRSFRKRFKNSDGSLDFERVINSYSIDAKRYEKKTEDNSSSKTTTRWILILLCAIVSGFITVVIVSVTEKVIAWRTRTFESWIVSAKSTNEFSLLHVFIYYVLFNLIMADMAAFLCLYWPAIPEAVGSGIPEVKSYLNGVRVKKFNNPSLVLVKIVGSVLSVGSSMAVGMEGPLVMIGACVGASLAHLGSALAWFVLKLKKLKNNGDSSKVLNWLYTFATTDLSYFANDAERRKLITVGASVGFAASFGAPIGGMLFVMDDISTFYDEYMFLRILVANSVGTFCLAMYRGDLSYYGAIHFGTFDAKLDENMIERQFIELPFWILLAIGGGLLGGFFCKAFSKIKKSSGKKFNTPALRLWRITYISIINSSIMFLLPLMHWVCHIPEDTTSFLIESTETAQQFFCGDGETNQMASIFFGSRAKAIVRILSEPGQFYASTLAIVGFVFYVLMLYTNTTAIPSGLFTPTVVVGASLGGCFGLIIQDYFDRTIYPTRFALLGVAAMMASIQRSTVSTCVILLEGTSQMRVLLPSMIVVFIANYVARLIHQDGIYEIIIKLKGYPYLEHNKHENFDVYTVKDLMSTSPLTLREKERAHHLVYVLKSTTHNGFPVVDEQGHFKGLVRRKQIVALMECGIFEQCEPGNEAIEESITNSSRSSKTNVVSGFEEGLMYYAFHIKDDRYNNVVVDDTVSAIDVSSFDLNNFLRDDENTDCGIDGEGEDISSDDEEAEAQNNENSDEVNFPSPTSSISEGPPEGFIRIRRSSVNNVVMITWLKPCHHENVVDLESVMNRGTFLVLETFPLSKAYRLFTLLGLRWIVVVNDRGTVVGVLTRESFIDVNAKMYEQK